MQAKTERDGHTVEVVGADTPPEVETHLPAITAIAQRDRHKPGELEQLAEGSIPGTVIKCYAPAALISRCFVSTVSQRHSRSICWEEAQCRGS